MRALVRVKHTQRAAAVLALQAGRERATGECFKLVSKGTAVANAARSGSLAEKLHRRPEQVQEEVARLRTLACANDRVSPLVPFPWDAGASEIDERCPSWIGGISLTPNPTSPGLLAAAVCADVLCPLACLYHMFYNHSELECLK